MVTDATAKFRTVRVITAIKTPYLPNGDIDIAAYDRLIEHQIANGVEGVIVGGTTGEGHLLSWEEHLPLIAHTKAKFQDKIMVVGNTGSNSTSEMAWATKKGFASGMDAALLINPYYGKTSDRGILMHLELALEFGPAFIYNVPGRTGQDIRPELMMQIKDHRHFIGVKECMGHERIKELTENGICCWTGNDDQMNISRHKYGAVGVISVASNIVPGLVRKLMHGEQDDDLDAKLKPLYQWLFAEPNPIGCNTLLMQLGAVKPVFRLPYTFAPREHREQGVKIIQSIGLEHCPAFGGEILRVLDDKDFRHLLDGDSLQRVQVSFESKRLQGCMVTAATLKLRTVRVITAIKTPYLPNGNIDIAAYDSLIEHQIAHGVEGIIVGGTTGEGHLLSWEEHLPLIAHTKAKFQDKIMVVGNTCSNSTSEMAWATKKGFASGMDAALLINPYYGKTSDRGILMHMELALEFGPAFIYNVPGRTGQDIRPELMMQIKDHRHFIGVKECMGHERIKELTENGICCWTGNDDQMNISRHKYGAVGVISVASNIVPGLVRKLMHGEQDDDLDAKLKPLYQWLFAEPNPIGCNTLLMQLGAVKPVFRLPYTFAPRDHREQGVKIIQSIGLEHCPAFGGEILRVLDDKDFGHLLDGDSLQPASFERKSFMGGA